MSLPQRKKQKRRDSPASQTNNSFASQIKSRVSGILPESFTKWFKGFGVADARSSVPVFDTTDTSSDDEAIDPMVIREPPAKRKRLSSPLIINHYSTRSEAPQSDLTSSNAAQPRAQTGVSYLEINKTPESIEVNTYRAGQSSLGQDTSTMRTNNVSTPFKSPNEDSVGEFSGTKSVIDSQYHSQHRNVSSPINFNRKRQPIFAESMERFEDTVYPSTSHIPKKVKTASVKPAVEKFRSPFDRGLTSYYGTNPYLPNIKEKKPAVVKKTLENNNISNTTKRIIDLLENMLSPLSDARRISPVANKSPNKLTNVSSVRSSPYIPRHMSYKTQELHVAKNAATLRLKQRSRLMNTTSVSRQIIASHSSSSNYIPSSTPYKLNNESKTETKTANSEDVTRITRPNRGGSLMKPSLEVVNLPTDVKIDERNLSEFAFGFTSTFTSFIEKNPDVTITVESYSPEVPAPNELSFTFSSPDPPTNANPFDSPSSLPKFYFGAGNIEESKADDRKTDSSIIPKVNDNKTSSTLKSADWKCSECWISNKMDVDKCVCCGEKKIIETDAKLSKCSTFKVSDSQLNFDKRENCDKTLSPSKLPIMGTTNYSKWKCEDCWAYNDEAAEECVCCGEKNPKKCSAPVEKATVSAVRGDWKCDECWIMNKTDVEKCAACGSGKAGATPNKQTVHTSPPTLINPNDKFKNIIKAQKEKWECPMCLTRNDNNRSKCFCCEAEKSGETKNDNAKSFNFDVVPNTTFKFGIDSNISQTKSLEINKMPETIIEAETNNNVLPKTQSFKFGITPKKPCDQESANEPTEILTNRSTEASKINFSFGVPNKKVVASPALPMFTKLSQASKENDSVANEEKEKPQEVPKVNLNEPLQLPLKLPEVPMPIDFSFGPKAQDEGPILSSPLIALQSQMLNNASSITATTSTTIMQRPTFTFSPSSEKPPLNIFGTPSSTASPVNINAFTPVLQNKTEQPMVSLFPNSEPKPTTTIFQQSKPVSDVPPAAAPASNLFSFAASNDNASSTMKSEKPQFKFTFGSLNDNNTMYKRTFEETATENNITNNPSNGSGNSIQTGNLLSNPLIFGASAQKENSWSGAPNNNNNNNANVFMPNTSFPNNNFSGDQGQTNFGANFTFGNNQQVPMPFGTNAPSPFSGTPMGTAFETPMMPPSIFDAGNRNQAPDMSASIFGTNNVRQPFGIPPAVPAFIPPALAPTATFNFGAPKSTGVFGFGQEPKNPTPNPQLNGIWNNFGGMSGNPAPVQFSMGISAANPPGARRVKKAVRRTTQPR